jgi:transcriptional regulator with XRE-family HTH domain
METFAQWIDRELDQRGWSRNEAARRGGISDSMFSKVINGYANPGIDFCRGVGRAFGMPLEDVLRLAGILPIKSARTNDHGPVYHIANNLSEREARAFERLGITDQELVVALTERLAGIVAGRIIGEEGE